MKTTGSLTVLALAVLLLPAAGRAGGLSPAERQIAQARAAIEKNPGRYQPYNRLALAFARRARETSDTKDYTRGLDALKKSFRLAPGNLEASKTEVWILLGQHEFARAQEAARTLQKRAPDDVLVYGFLTDASVELGDYKEADEAAQWMLDLRPGNVPGLTRGAYLRELYGDPDGAIEFMQQAYDRTPPTETEDRAWVLTQIAHLHLSAGRMDAAEKTLDQALALFPGYHYALAGLAKVRTAQGRHGEAAALLERRYRAAPHPENLYDLANALAQAGHAAQARRAYKEFETKARHQSARWDNANRELIAYYCGPGANPKEALRVATMEIARRHDVHTLDAYAWALYTNGKYDEARGVMARALAVGIKDPAIVAHAGAIAKKAGARAAARAS